MDFMWRDKCVKNLSLDYFNMTWLQLFSLRYRRHQSYHHTIFRHCIVVLMIDYTFVRCYKYTAFYTALVAELTGTDAYLWDLQKSVEVDVYDVEAVDMM